MVENRFRVSDRVSRIEWTLIGMDTEFLNSLKVALEKEFERIRGNLNSLSSDNDEQPARLIDVKTVADVLSADENKGRNAHRKDSVYQFYLLCAEHAEAPSAIMFDELRAKANRDSHSRFYSLLNKDLAALHQNALTLALAVTQAWLEREAENISELFEWLRKLKHLWANQLMRVRGRLELIQQDLLHESQDAETAPPRAIAFSQSALHSLKDSETAIRNLAYLTGEKVFPSYRALYRSALGAVERYQKSPRTGQSPLVLHVDRPVQQSESEVEPAFEHAISNLIENALEASSGVSKKSAEIVIETLAPARVQGATQGQSPITRIRVRDYGRGCLPEAISTRYLSLHALSPGGKLGLGIPTTLKILRAYGAGLWVTLPPGGGTEFIVEVPISTW